MGVRHASEAGGIYSLESILGLLKILKIRALYAMCSCRGSNFYLCLYWAECLAKSDPAWAPFAEKLRQDGRLSLVNPPANQAEA
jgi:hypothetical protein